MALSLGCSWSNAEEEVRRVCGEDLQWFRWSCAEKEMRFDEGGVSVFRKEKWFAVWFCAEKEIELCLKP